MLYLKRFSIFLLFLLILSIGYSVFQVRSQGVSRDFWKSYTIAKVSFDSRGIPTIEASDTNKLFEAQGYVVASERLFQMDLIRRKATGRLSELVGVKAFEYDKKIQSEDRLGVISAAVRDLPAGERETCEHYAKGVNQYIKDNSGKWSIEYEVLRAEPSPWTCEDSFAVLMEMCEFLTQSRDTENVHMAWAKQLPKSWDAYLFPFEHPWSKPLFPSKLVGSTLKFPAEADYLPMKPLAEVEGRQAAIYEESIPIGSNNWVYHGKNGYFLANDPHMGFCVPQIWFAIKLKATSEKNLWAVGSALPGMPGIVLGMNPFIAWAFTNTSEDVDDLVLEKIDPEHTKYLAKIENGKEIWNPILKTELAIRVKGEKEPRKITAEFTHRGPLTKQEHLGDGFYSRQWLPFQKGVLRLPLLEFMRSKSIEDLNNVIDLLRVPAQNILSMDRAGNFNYRVSGSAIKRRMSGDFATDYRGEWAGLEPVTERRRLTRLAKEIKGSSFIATANERIWFDNLRNHFFSEDRKFRIVEVLSQSDNLTQADMQKLHLDTTGRLRRTLLNWLVERAKQTEHAEVLERWNAWDGDARKDPIIFAQAEKAEGVLREVLLGRLKAHFQIAPELKYRWHAARTVVTMFLEAEGEKAARVFGLESQELALRIIKETLAKPVESHEIANRWKAQHPFSEIPVVGRFFKVEEFSQYGHYDLVNAELPIYGPSLRFVWNMSNPKESTWTFPVGQSGHISSSHYKDFQASWHAGKTFRVFESDDEWERFSN